MTNDPGEGFRFFTPPPKQAGAYWLGGTPHGFGFCLARRPRWLHRFMTRLLLGWEWVDSD
jgi:hypothetical protein